MKLLENEIRAAPGMEKLLPSQTGRFTLLSENLELRAQYTFRKRLEHRLRGRVYGAIKSKKAGSAVRDLGCSLEELRRYLELKFQPGMTWWNWGMDGWHIDHIEPLCNFDLTDRNQFLEACHYTNLQPLWAQDNLKKGRAELKQLRLKRSSVKK
jgi:hypothetical protein